MKTIKFKLKPESQNSGWKETLELLETSFKVTSYYDNNPLNDMDIIKRITKETHEWYADSCGILYSKEFLDKHYDEVK